MYDDYVNIMIIAFNYLLMDFFRQLSFFYPYLEWCLTQFVLNSWVVNFWFSCLVSWLHLIILPTYFVEREIGDDNHIVELNYEVLKP